MRGPHRRGGRGMMARRQAKDLRPTAEGEHKGDHRVKSKQMCREETGNAKVGQNLRLCTFKRKLINQQNIQTGRIVFIAS